MKFWGTRKEREKKGGRRRLLDQEAQQTTRTKNEPNYTPEKACHKATLSLAWRRRQVTLTPFDKSFRLCGRRRVWDVSREQHRHVYYLGWNTSPAQVGCMRQALRPGALGRPRGIGWRGRRERGSGWGTHVNPWLFYFNVWQNPLQYKKF